MFQRHCRNSYLVEGKPVFCRKIVSAVCLACLLVAVGSLWAPRSFAQSSCSIPANLTFPVPYCGEHAGAVGGAVGASYGNAIASLQSEMLDATVFGLAAAQASAGGVEAGIFPTGRLRQTYHDGYKVVGETLNVASPSFSTSEGSAFGTLFFKTPPSILGGQLQLGAFAGYDDLFMKLSPYDSVFQKYRAKAENESFLYGGYGLYTTGSSYLMLTLSGAEGSTDLSSGLPLSKPASYDTHGFIGAFSAGHVLPLSSATASTPLKLDLRGGVNYVNTDGDAYQSPIVTEFTYAPSLETWNGSLAATLFSQIPSNGGGMWRPFVKGEFRHQLSYDNTVHETINWGQQGAVHDYRFDQSDTTGALEVGLDYVIKGLTFNAAAYGELSTDRETYGGRIGAKVTFP